MASGRTTYAQACEETWAPLRANGGKRELVRCATMAANSHNSQPWTFAVSTEWIKIQPDYGRRCPAVDPDDHHLFASLGCAAENLFHAAEAMGLRAHPRLEGNEVRIDLERAPASHSLLLEAMPHRQCTRSLYDSKPVANDIVRQLEQAAAGFGTSVLIVTDPARRSQIADLVVEGNTLQMRDKAFIDELLAWMRFNERDAVATRDGLFSRASGNPSLPAWLARRLLPMVFTQSGENHKYRIQIGSSAGIVVFASEADDKAHWFNAGRACQRFALQATALGLKYAFINQPVEARSLRAQLASLLGLGSLTPDLVVRFGAAPALPQSLRRPPEQVTI